MHRRIHSQGLCTCRHSCTGSKRTLTDTTSVERSVSTQDAQEARANGTIDVSVTRRASEASNTRTVVSVHTINTRGTVAARDTEGRRSRAQKWNETKTVESRDRSKTRPGAFIDISLTAQSAEARSTLTTVSVETIDTSQRTVLTRIGGTPERRHHVNSVHKSKRACRGTVLIDIGLAQIARVARVTLTRKAVDEIRAARRTGRGTRVRRTSDIGRTHNTADQRRPKKKERSSERNALINVGTTGEAGVTRFARAHFVCDERRAECSARRIARVAGTATVERRAVGRDAEHHVRRQRSQRCTLQARCKLDRAGGSHLRLIERSSAQELDLLALVGQRHEADARARTATAGVGHNQVTTGRNRGTTRQQNVAAHTRLTGHVPGTRSKHVDHHTDTQHTNEKFA